MSTTYNLQPTTSSQHYTIIFTGRSGCGKGTQAKLLIENIKSRGCPEDAILYVETGNRFREFIKGDNMASNRSREIMVSGERQPDFLAVTMWANVFIEELKPNHEHLVLDGTPRALNEAKTLDQALKFFKRENPIVINVKVSREKSIEHMHERAKKEGRADDLRPGDIEKRLAWFERDVVPAIEYFRTNSDYQFIEVDGERSIEEVHSEILIALGIK
ncbi:MAG: nucleoside monophosphate kinase [Candidatus Vogelbacteria bacterium]|nr:nucleoside monophosphate kinase [Candidatus Vogelbacteria bacterium]